MKKFTKISLACALILGGLGIGSMADLPIPGLQSKSADAATMEDVNFTEGNTAESRFSSAVLVYIAVKGNNVGLSDFAIQHNARYTIKNSTGTIVKTGSLNAFEVFHSAANDYDFYSLTNVSLAGLPKNASHYRLDILLPVENGTFTGLNTGHFTKKTGYSTAFTYNADGSVTNFRD